MRPGKSALRKPRGSHNHDNEESLRNPMLSDHDDVNANYNRFSDDHDNDHDIAKPV